MSQPSWAAWIEISPPMFNSSNAVKSQPSWAAWIEILTSLEALPCYPSQPSWAAWIEIVTSTVLLTGVTCRSPLGLRGLK